MTQTKETVKALLDRLPDDCSLDDVLYHLYVIQAVESGLEDVAHDRVITHDAVAQELRRKWQVGRAKQSGPRARAMDSTGCWSTLVRIHLLRPDDFLGWFSTPRNP